MRYWLMKSEPDVFSIDDLAKAGKSGWDGVRNYQARNYMRDEMRPGDIVFFYHSNAEPPGIAGLAEVAPGGARPDPTQFEKKSEYYDPKSKPEAPTWMMVDVKFREKFPRLVSLDEIRAAGARLEGLPLLARGTRLSVMPVSEAHAQVLLGLSSLADGKSR